MTQSLLQLDTLRRPWIDEAVDGFQTRVAAGLIPREFSTDDLHSVYDEPSEPNAWGSMLAQLKKAGTIIKVGYRVSSRPSANCRPISLWRIA